MQAADERVLTFLQQQNRPFNAQGVTDHLAQFGIKKAQAQKALDALSESGKINCKVEMPVHLSPIQVKKHWPAACICYHLHS